jgi:hypothetical protein
LTGFRGRLTASVLVLWPGWMLIEGFVDQSHVML